MCSSPWYHSDKTETNQILSSRVRLARNLEKYPFQRNLTENDASSIVQDINKIIGLMNKGGIFNELFLHELDKFDYQIFLEKHILSPKFLTCELPKSLYTEEHKNISIMVNEEDHVRIQSIEPGRNLQSAFRSANRIDDLLEKRLDFAFHPDLGYLTSCPTNVGTGLRASFLIHLPCLDKTNLLKKLFPYISKSGITLRGIYGEGTIPLGSLFQISNQITTGQTEEEIMKKLEDVTDNIIKRENQVMDKILSTRRDYLNDKVYRAYGILSSCRKISVNEAMNLLSDIRLGYFAKILDMPKPEKRIYQIMMEIQPGHLLGLTRLRITEAQVDIVRAEFLRRIFKS